MAGLDAATLALRASQATVAGLFDGIAAAMGDGPAIQSAEAHYSYREFATRVRRTAAVLHGWGAVRVAILSENRSEYLETQLAAARLGGVVACLNWRLTPGEIQHCLDLTDPEVLLVSPRHARLLGPVRTTARVIEFGVGWEAMLRQVGPAPDNRAQSEAPWLILYTGGTTGLPKGAVLSQRAVLARMPAMEHDLGLRPGDPCLAWPPMFHMGGTEPALHALLTGGEVLIEDGYDPARLATLLTQRPFGWISVQPGTLGLLIAALEQAPGPLQAVRGCGVMPDLVPEAQLIRLAALLGAPYRNTFGSTETGTPPLSGAAVVIGDGPLDLAKAPSPFTDIRLVDAEDQDVPEGEVGELAMRGPTLFSGYWRDSATTAWDFRNGWFHMGDLFRRRADGRYVFVDRAKYMIKSGGENIYPAEIERVLMTHPGVTEAAVIRVGDERWGETPVALVAVGDEAVTVEALHALCRQHLAGFKQPKRIMLVPAQRLARTQTGKLPRVALEEWVKALPNPAL